MATIDDIRQYFSNILQRSGTEVSDAEINSYVSAVDSGALTLAQARAALINSPEGQDVQDVVRLYQVVFGRVPDQAGLNFQVDALRGPANEQNIAEGFAASPEFATRFGGNTVNTAFINAVYQQVLGRAPSAGEVQFYLDSGFSAARIALAFSEAPEFRNSVNTAVTNFLDAAGQGTAVYSGPLGGAGGVPTNPGQTFTLTNNIDNVVGTAGNDSVVASSTTLNAGDNINGGAGTDKLSLFIDGTAIPAVTVSNVEQIFVQNTGAQSINANTFTGAQQFWAQSSSENISFTGLAVAQTGGIKGTIAAGKNVEFAYNNVGGTADAATLALDGASVTGASTVTINGIETLNVAGSGSIVGLTDTSLKTLNVAANGATSITTAATTTATTINASASTAGVTINTAAQGASDQTFTGGAGNDKFIVANVTAADKFDGGAGTDTLSVAGGDFRLATNDVLKGVNGATNIEQLEFTGVTGAQVNGDTFTNTTINKLIFNGAGNDVVELGGARVYAFGANNSGDASIAQRVGSTTLNVALEGAAAADGANAEVGTLTTSGATTINIASSGVAGVAANTIGSIAVAANTVVNATGSQALTIGGFTAPVSFDGSAAAGVLTITGSTGIDVLKGGSGNDVLNGGGSAAVAAVAEVQKFTVTNGSDADGGTVTIAGVDVVIGNSQSIDQVGTAIQGAEAAIKAANANIDTVTYDAVTDTVSVTYKNTAGDVATTTATDKAASTGVTFGTVTETTKGVAGSAGVAFTADTFTGGAGNDKFIVGTASAATATDADVITDFLTKADTIDFQAYAVAGSATTYKEATAAVADFTAAKTAADALFAADTTTVYVAQQVGSDTYVFAAAAAGNASEQVVKLTGVSLAGIEATDIVA
ncbi:DUF4214 domain-containing protein [Antarcticirhabdus aurantiaca]|uniref:DUF4214 domain-containing protein n=1 Tax=Antarcticirhabdus aurantiaca TaxID=2606717 RepID=UPI00131C124D|nr:DUF4214 domain-containing protein [Antarcticirhabdus aurantiaca]